MTLEELSIIISISAEDALKQLDEISEKLEAFSKEQKEETKKAFDSAPITDFGKVAKVTLDSFASSAKDATKDVVKSLKESEGGVLSLSGVMKGLLGSAGSILTGGLAGLAVEAIGWIPTIIENIAASQEKLREEERKQEEARKQGILDASATELESLECIRELDKRYNELAQKENRTVEESAELSRIRQELADKFNIEAAAVAFAADEYERLNAAMAQQEENILNTLYLKQNDTTWMRIKEAKEATEQTFLDMEELKKIRQNVENDDFLSTYLGAAYTPMDSVFQNMGSSNEGLLKAIQDTAQNMKIELQKVGKEANFTILDVIDRMMADSESTMTPVTIDLPHVHSNQP